MLSAGEERLVSFAVDRTMLEMMSASGKWIVEPGMFRIMIGSSSRDLDLKTDLEVK
jgi:beta-glucosidase